LYREGERERGREKLSQRANHSIVTAKREEKSEKNRLGFFIK